MVRDRAPAAARGRRGASHLRDPIAAYMSGEALEERSGRPEEIAVILVAHGGIEAFAVAALLEASFKFPIHL